MTRWSGTVGTTPSGAAGQRHVPGRPRLRPGRVLRPEPRGRRVPYGAMNVNLRTGVATGDGIDTLRSMWAATGSDGPDTMIGNSEANLFFLLLGGRDTVDAGGGNDYVYAGAGADHLMGGPGRDLVGFWDFKNQGKPRPTGVTVDLSTGTGFRRGHTRRLRTHRRQLPRRHADWKQRPQQDVRRSRQRPIGRSRRCRQASRRLRPGHGERRGGNRLVWC